MPNIVVADTKKHAEAVIYWLKLDESWIPKAFGDDLPPFISFAKIVRPASGVQHDHFAWIMHFLLPRVSDELQPVPSSWVLEPEKPGEIDENEKSAFFL